MPGGQTLPGDRVFASDADVEAVTFSSDGTILAGICRGGAVRLWDTRSGQVSKTLPPEKAVMLVNPLRGDWLASSVTDGGFKVWDFNSGQVLGRVPVQHGEVRRIAASRDGQLIAGADHVNLTGSEYQMRLWDASGTERFSAPAGLGGVAAIAFSPDGGNLVASGYDTNLRVWKTRDGELVRLVEELPVAMFALAFSPDGRYLAAAGADRIVYLFDTKTWNLTRKLQGQPEMIRAMAFSPDSRMLLTGGFSVVTEKNPVKVLLWEVASGAVLRTLPSPHMVTSVAFSPDGTLAASAALDKGVSLWSIPRR